MTRLLIFDDHPIVRQGLRSLLSNYPEFDVFGEAAAVDEGSTRSAGTARTSAWSTSGAAARRGLI